jgi:hypothetical protein
MMLLSPILKAFLYLVLLVSLPLLGAWWAGQPLTPYLGFPPKPWPVAEVPFSWPLFWGYLVLELPLYAALGWALRFKPGRALGAFPRWGWGALGWLAAAWYIAWVRPAWLGGVKDFSFTLLWLGYIGVINALCQQRTGFCLLTRQPKFFLGLFPVSAGFWWYFEYLNRFVGNWHYLGAEDASAWQYFWRATLPFSTVLPAVASTIAWLGTWLEPRSLPPLHLPHPRRLAWSGVVLGSLGLFGIGGWPQGCFPLLWLAPLAFLAGLQGLSGQTSYFAPLRQGKWEILLLPMLAGLMCGVFWEMWNSLSCPKWVYTVPFVSRFKLFEMPILGYAGYLPFGLECALVVDFWSKSISHPAPARRSC